MEKWNKMDKLVSIVLCTYNRAYCVGKAVESVLAQTYSSWELFVIDDGSTDDTEAVIEQYADPRIHYIKMNKNRFYCYAANHGLGYCKGEYIAFLNSDDAWFPEKLEKQVSFMEQNIQYGACFTEVILTDNEGKDISEECTAMSQLFATRHHGQAEWLKSFLNVGNSLCHPSALIRKCVIDDIGKFNHKLDSNFQCNQIVTHCNHSVNHRREKFFPFSPVKRGIFPKSSGEKHILPGGMGFFCLPLEDTRPHNIISYTKSPIFARDKIPKRKEKRSFFFSLIL